jgi:cytochrome c
MLPRTALCSLGVVLCLIGVSAAARAGDAERGQALYESRCFACHSLDQNRVGPMHRGVFGRKAGSVADYEYSNALKSSGIVWSRTTLDAWLSGPSKFVPGSKMGFQVAKPEDRDDIISFLEQRAK